MRKLLFPSAIAAVFGLALMSLPTTASAQPAWQVPPGWSFTGGYVGLNLGAVQNIDNGDDVSYYHNIEYGSGSIPPVFGKMHAIGFIGGATLGYNWQLDRLVIGVEGDYDGSSLNGSVSFTGHVPEVGIPGATGTFNASEQLSWFSTERLRLGFVTSPGSMVYLTGGAAQGQWQLQSNYIFPAVSYPETTQATRTGWAEGIGYETALASRITFKVDVLSYNLQPFQTQALPNTAYFGYTAGKDFFFHGTTARIGINWKL